MSNRGGGGKIMASRGYQIFPRSQKYRDHFDEIFNKKSPAEDDQAIFVNCEFVDGIPVGVPVPWDTATGRELSQPDFSSDPPDNPPDKG